MLKDTTLTDSNGNQIIVPQGFKIAEDSGINVTEGIVIEDNDVVTDGNGNQRGNQYVWVPVGKEIKKSDGTTVNIELGRYTFADGENDKDTEGILLSKGTPILQQSAEKYTEEIIVNNYYMEYTYSKTGSNIDQSNTTALNLKGFIDSVREKGGYYIARYEASYGKDGKANSKVSNTYLENAQTKNEGGLWSYATQLEAAKASRKLYSNLETDLTNSYAWDTAIVYIQEFSEHIDYSYHVSKNTTLTNTGKCGDEVCKINDMSSNAREWTTENSSFTVNTYAYHGVARGGEYLYGLVTCEWRAFARIQTAHYSFRTILYI